MWGVYGMVTEVARRFTCPVQVERQQLFLIPLQHTVVVLQGQIDE
jgi:hypothetical protein